ncbi:MAG: class I SAM-dependent methyltransferase [Bacteroidia bacterium]
MIGRVAYAYLKWKQGRRSEPSPLLSGIGLLYKRLRSASQLFVSVEHYGAKVKIPGEVLSISLATLIRRGATPPWKGRLLYEIVRARVPQRILELGTHLGFGTMYLAAAAPQAEIVTIEASPTLAERARLHFKLLGLKPKIQVGLFEAVIPTLAGEWDVIYIDGDHRGSALHEYVGKLYPQLSPAGLIICDDIFWSWDMWRGWKSLSQAYPVKRYILGPFGILVR